MDSNARPTKNPAASAGTASGEHLLFPQGRLGFPAFQPVPLLLDKKIRGHPLEGFGQMGARLLWFWIFFFLLALPHNEVETLLSASEFSLVAV